MYIAGYQKLTLLDYPTKVAAICFTAGCQLRCAYCHNADLVMCKNNQFDKTLNQTESFLRYVEKRKACLGGVVISGGEPLLQENIENFAAEIKKLGLQVKLDTNGLLPERLNRLLEQKAVDYVALDYKNCHQYWNDTVGLHQSEEQKSNQIKQWRQSLFLLRKSDISYEIRTTVVRQLHPAEALLQMAKKLSMTENKKEKWYLQPFKQSGMILQDYTTEHENKKMFDAYLPQEMQQIIEQVKQYVPGARWRQ